MDSESAFPLSSEFKACTKGFDGAVPDLGLWILQSNPHGIKELFDMNVEQGWGVFGEFLENKNRGLSSHFIAFTTFKPFKRTRHLKLNNCTGRKKKQGNLV